MSRSIRRSAVALFAVALSVAPACGDKATTSTQSASAGRSTTTTTGAPDASSPTAPVGQGGTSEAAGASGSSDGTPTTVKGGKAGDGATTTSTSASAARPNIRLDRSCVPRGSATEMQGFQADVHNRAIVIYSTEYSDHSNEVTNKTYTSGFGYVHATEEGARTTWVVPATAPVGTAIVHVSGSEDVRPRELSFRVVVSKDDCR